METVPYDKFARFEIAQSLKAASLKQNGSAIDGL
jgi:hypothetical protein